MERRKKVTMSLKRVVMTWRRAMARQRYSALLKFCCVGYHYCRAS